MSSLGMAAPQVARGSRAAPTSDSRSRRPCCRSCRARSARSKRVTRRRRRRASVTSGRCAPAPATMAHDRAPCDAAAAQRPTAARRGPSRSSAGKKATRAVGERVESDRLLPSAQVSVTRAKGTGRPAPVLDARRSAPGAVSTKRHAASICWSCEELADIIGIELGIEQIVMIARGQHARARRRRPA